MKRLRSSPLAAIALIALVAADAARPAPAPPPRSGLEQVPATAPIVFHLRGAQGARDRLAAMMKESMPDLLNKFLPKLDDLLKNGENGRKPRGLTKNGPVFLAFTELPKVDMRGDQPPKAAFIAAITNYKEFRDNLLTEEEIKNIKSEDGVDSVKSGFNDTVYFVDRKTYAVVTPVEEVAKSFTKTQAGLDGKLSKEQAAKLLAGDVGVYVDVEAINKEYGEYIKMGREQLEQFLDMAASTAEGKQKESLEQLKKIIGPVMQIFEDSQVFLATAEFRPGGLALHAGVEFRAESNTARSLQDSRPERFRELDRLPDGRSYYIAMKGGSSLFKGFGAMFSGFPGAGTQTAAAMMEELAKAGPRISLGGLSFPLAGLSVSQYDDPAQAVASTLKIYRNMEPKAAGLKDKPTVKENAEKYSEFKLHHAEIAWDFDKLIESLPNLGEEQKKQMMESMKGFLGEKTNTWFGTDGKLLVQVNAADWPAARKMLDQYFKDEKTVGKVKEFRALRKELPSAATFLMILEGVQFPTSIIEMMKWAFGDKVPPGWPAPPSGDGPAYIGLSVTLQPRHGSFDAFVPGPAAGEVYKALIKPLLGE